MSLALVADLKSAKTEEEIKDAYVKALHLKNVSKGEIDIKTKDIWFEAKLDVTPIALMFAQLLTYVVAARRNGSELPPLLGVVDRQNAAFLETASLLELIENTEVEWPTPASDVVSKKWRSLVDSVSRTISPHVVSYDVLMSPAPFVFAVEKAMAAKKIIRQSVDLNNIREVFNEWVREIGSDLIDLDEVNYALVFFTDIMHDGRKPVVENMPARLYFDGATWSFHLHNTFYPILNQQKYNRFWAWYDRPPLEDARAGLLERRDTLLPESERARKGAFFTPIPIARKAYAMLQHALGETWQDDFIVWDMCCGTGNLERIHSNHRNIFMSTLDQADIDLMNTGRVCVAATKFQYDYLNDDITDTGEIDYSLTGKVPLVLRQAIADAKAGKPGAKKILVLMNPPYAEATSGGNTVSGAESQSKVGVSATRVAALAMREFGKASNELFTQFVARAHIEIPNATLAMFSKLKYVTAPTLDNFRRVWAAKYLDGFVVHSKMFEGLTGNFPIGFLIWDTSQTQTIDIIDPIIIGYDLQSEGVKKFESPDQQNLLTDWIVRPRANNDVVVPLKNALVPATASKDLRGTRWSDGAIGYFNCAGNEPQNTSKLTMLFSSGYGSGRGLFVNKENLWQVAVAFSVRRLIKPTWLNDRDQFLQPSGPLTEEFKTDCLIWMLFNGSNLSAGANGLEWNGKTWSLVNHFIPFTEDEVGARHAFESHFMSDYLKGKELSQEAKAVLDAGRELWRAYHATTMPRSIRDEFKLGRADVGWYQIRADVGWYQIRKALDANKENKQVDFGDFKTAYDALTQKLRPLVYSLGFLKE